MEFRITIKGKSNTSHLPQTETELCRFVSEIRQAALNHDLDLEIPVEVFISFEKTFLVDGIVCLISGGPGVS